jgi:hypothetical protein
VRVIVHLAMQWAPLAMKRPLAHEGQPRQRSFEVSAAK